MHIGCPEQITAKSLRGVIGSRVRVSRDREQLAHEGVPRAHSRTIGSNSSGSAISVLSRSRICTLPRAACSVVRRRSTSGRSESCPFRWLPLRLLPFTVGPPSSFPGSSFRSATRCVAACPLPARKQRACRMRAGPIATIAECNPCAYAPKHGERTPIANDDDAAHARGWHAEREQNLQNALPDQATGEAPTPPLARACIGIEHQVGGSACRARAPGAMYAIAVALSRSDARQRSVPALVDQISMLGWKAASVPRWFAFCSRPSRSMHPVAPSTATGSPASGHRQRGRPEKTAGLPSMERRARPS